MTSAISPRFMRSITFGGPLGHLVDQLDRHALTLEHPAVPAVATSEKPISVSRRASERDGALVALPDRDEDLAGGRQRGSRPRSAT
jgi:hypothetical protein